MAPTLKDGTLYEFPDAEAAQPPRLAALVAMSDRYGNSYTLTRDSNRNLTKIATPNGRYVEFTYDASNRITQAKDNIGRIVGYTYDASGRLQKVTNPQGGLTQYTYDTSHRMLTIKIRSSRRTSLISTTRTGVSSSRRWPTVASIRLLTHWAATAK